MRALSPANAATPSGVGKGVPDPIVFRDDFESPAPTEPEPAAVPLAIKLLNAAAYGPRPGDIAAFNALPPRARSFSMWPV